MNLQQLLDAIQTEKYATQPLAAHRIAGLDDHAREHYALLLSAVLRAGDSIGAAQSRVFAMLLEAMGLQNRQASMFERAQALTAADLTECRRLLAEHGLIQSFLLDALVLLRLETPLNDDELRLCAELADLLQVDSATLSDLVALASAILGMRMLGEFPDKLDYNDYPHWFEFTCEKVTAAKLAASLPPGRWLLKDCIEMNTGWSLANVTLFFAEGARLDTCTVAKATVTIKNCYLINPVMQFKRETLSVTLQDCTVEGDYPEHAQLTAFHFDAIQAATIGRTNFSTRGARAVHSVHIRLKFEDCRFIECGNRHLVGGALAVRRIQTNRGVYDFTLTDCRFSRCIARLGGALRIDRLNYYSTTIARCLFDSCSAVEPGLDYSIYADNIVTEAEKRFIQDSQFKRGGFYLGDRSKELGGGSYDHVFSSLNLIDAKLYANMRYEAEFKTGIKQTGNCEIRTNVKHQLPVWAKDF